MFSNKTKASKMTLRATSSETTLVDVSQMQGASLVDKAKAASAGVKKGPKSSSWSKLDPYYVSWEARVFAAINK